MTVRRRAEVVIRILERHHAVVHDERSGCLPVGKNERLLVFDRRVAEFVQASALTVSPSSRTFGAVDVKVGIMALLFGGRVMRRSARLDSGHVATQTHTQNSVGFLPSHKLVS
jgi:hypothetical protein